MAAVDEFSQLKRLILGQEQQSIERLQERVEEPATRAQDVAEVLVESFELNEGNCDALAAAMRAPVQRCISDAVREDPDEFADVVFPVIGAAIRKAVRDSISALREKINRTLERSFSRVQRIKWRLESMRTGVPVSEMVLRDSFDYRVDQAFVIQRRSGLLLGHVAREGASDQDSDAVSALLTEIQDFVRDSFNAGDGADLDTIRVGGERVWIFHGPNAITAAIIHGQPPREMRNVFEKVAENIHRSYAEQIANFANTESPQQEIHAGISSLLYPLLETKSAGNIQTKKQDNNRALKLLGAGMLVLLAAWLVDGYLSKQKLNRLIDKLEQTPGIEVMSVVAANPAKIKALRDPLASKIDQILVEQGFAEDEIIVESIPFQSLAPEIVVTRLRILLDAPSSVIFRIDDSRLVLSGEAPRGFRARLSEVPISFFGLDEVDTRALNTSNAETIAAIREELNAPDTAKFRLEQQTAFVSGVVPLDWIMRVRGKKIGTRGVDSIDFSGANPGAESILDYLRETTSAPDLVAMSLEGESLKIAGSHTERWRQALEKSAMATGYVTNVDVSQFIPAEVEEMEVLARYISEQTFYFSRNDQLANPTKQLMARLGADLQRLAAIDELLGDVEARYLVSAYADNSGTPEQNDAVRKLRASKVSKFLVDNGVKKSQITTRTTQSQVADDESLQWRRAEVKISISKE
ncbi:MAG: OmpA family protein [Gammaproteobacteria bacterium]